MNGEILVVSVLRVLCGFIRTSGGRRTASVRVGICLGRFDESGTSDRHQVGDAQAQIHAALPAVHVEPL
jgi:hypothetical protein